MLRELVQQGKLPPVEERLPENPVVVPVVEEIGQYGGTWNRAFLGLSDLAGVTRITYNPPLRRNIDGSEVLPNVFASWEVADEGRVFTFHLRKGMRWSDGAAYTADDILFWYEDIILNEELTPVIPSWFTIEGVPGILSKVDDYTVRVEFASPYGLFPQMLTQPNTIQMVSRPKHYLSQFHPRYAHEEELMQATRAAGLEAWYQLFNLKADPLKNPDEPTINAWKLISDPAKPPYIMERNPYYWKVDPEGNQLPYIDRVVQHYADNAEVINLMAVSGDIDMQLRHIQFLNYPLLMENSERSGYRVLMWPRGIGANPYIAFNLNYPDDPILRDIFLNEKFRQAASLAINRDEINELMFFGLGEPRQATVVAESVYYKPEFARAYADYNPDEANRLLDSIGLDKRDAQGYRLRPDGKRLQVLIEIPEGGWGPWIDIAELVKDYWEAVGISTDFKVLERSYWFTRADAGITQVTFWTMDYQLTPLVNPDKLLPRGDRREIAHDWNLWYDSGGTRGVKPTGVYLKAFELYDQAKSTPDEAEQIRLTQEILQLQSESWWFIGTVGSDPALVVVKDYFRNVPEVAPEDYLLGSPGNTYPEQYFIKR